MAKDLPITKHFELTDAELDSIIQDGVARILVDSFEDVDDGKKYKG